MYNGGVALSHALSPVNVPNRGGFFSPLISPKEHHHHQNEMSPQPMISEDIYGEPHFS